VDNPQQQPNPHTTIENPYAQYQDSLDELSKMFPEIHEFARTCYEIFLMSNDGKILWEILQNKFLWANLVNPTSDNCANTSLYWTGFTDCIKQFRQLGLQHKQRINAV
jgi:hypothetical protein